jgi:hypothetical protein
MGLESTGGGGSFDYWTGGSWGSTFYAGVHRVTNLISGQGNWSRLQPFTHSHKTTGKVAVSPGSGAVRGDNTPSDVTISATAYAKSMTTLFHPLRGEWGSVAYQWCHLQGLGIGGTNDDGNLVCGSKWLNGEMIVFENWLKERDRGGSRLHIEVSGKLAWGSKYLVENVTYKIYKGAYLLGSFWLDGRRAEPISGGKVKQMNKDLNDRLAKAP